MSRLLTAAPVLAAVLLLPALAPQAQPTEDQKRIERLEMRVLELEIGEKERRIAELELHVAILEAYLKKQDPRLAAGFEKGLQAAKVVVCANNLRQLWVLQTWYSTQFGGTKKEMPSATGSAFWIALTKTEPPLLAETELRSLVCPLSGRNPLPGYTTYRGPSISVNKLAGDDVVGCCEPGHHPDGTINVLKKSGEVVAVGPNDALFKKAVDSTSRLSAEDKK
jgi:hypothetical protein